MAAELKEKFDTEIQFIKGDGGVFEIKLENKPIFSKKQLSRFPEPGEIAALIANIKT